MFALNNILSGVVNSDATLFGEGVAAKDFSNITDQEIGMFQDALLGAAGKEEEMLTLLGQDEQVDQDKQNQTEEMPVSSREILSALSFLSIVGVIPSPIAYQTPLPLQDTFASWTFEIFAPAMASTGLMNQTPTSQEAIIQTILENATPSYVMQTAVSETGLADSDLDSIISELLLSKNKQMPRESALADLGWNHFNEAILTDADQGNNDLRGFTFEEEGAKPFVGALLATPKELNNITAQEKLIEPQAKLTASPAKLTESVIVTVRAQQVSPLQEDAKKPLLSDIQVNLDPSVLGQTGISTQPQPDGVKTEARIPEWRPQSQIVEHEVVKQVADKLAMHRFESNGVEGVTIELEPKELGALKIELSIHKNFVSADIITEHASVRDILDKNQVLLRDALTGLGFTVDQFSVNVGDFSQLPHHSSGQEQFDDNNGTQFALDNNREVYADSELAWVGGGSRHWGNVESGISVYV